MKQATLALLGLATLLSMAACHKTAPVASKPADTTPVAVGPGSLPVPAATTARGESRHLGADCTDAARTHNDARRNARR